MTKIIALFNQAGGVGKSTVTQNLGYHLALRGHRVLLVDMDPQASLTIFMGIDITNLQNTIYDALIADEPENESDRVAISIYPEQLHKMSLAPASVALANAEIRLATAIQREFRLKEILEPILDDYDYILIDCPPSLGLLSINCLVAATHMLVPIETQYKALMGTDMLLGTFRTIRRKLNKSLAIAGFLPTRYWSSNSMDRQTLESINSQLSQIGTVFSPLPRATAVSEASQYGKPFLEYIKKKSENHLAVLAVFDEISLAMEAL
ncbi:AAA family ATPase [Pseudanabaena galeata UHCC 0370]|jgi:chromosome partitioning protein|uniref:AAA family ATPase n=1 Tax=Pseudanabaena galeata UHCC 0370 TaxID=3110310 RepID=A0ABU5THV1_9CYAN|nr:AAA family ATPase [Pseudanabaena galeata]MEA5477841.1 AAA family ATPase [Pseudanabaena galeata UHCC 0370]